MFFTSVVEKSDVLFDERFFSLVVGRTGKLFGNILAKMFFTSVVEKSTALFEKTSSRKGCFSDLLSREAVCFCGKLLFDKKDGF